MHAGEAFVREGKSGRLRTHQHWYGRGIGRDQRIESVHGFAHRGHSLVCWGWRMEWLWMQVGSIYVCILAEGRIQAVPGVYTVYNKIEKKFRGSAALRCVSRHGGYTPTRPALVVKEESHTV